MTPEEMEKGIECVGEALATYGKARGHRKVDPTDLLTDLFHWVEQGEGEAAVEALAKNCLLNWRSER